MMDCSGVRAMGVAGLAARGDAGSSALAPGPGARLRTRGCAVSVGLALPARSLAPLSPEEEDSSDCDSSSSVIQSEPCPLPRAVRDRVSVPSMIDFPEDVMRRRVLE